MNTRNNVTANNLINPHSVDTRDSINFRSCAMGIFYSGNILHKKKRQLSFENCRLYNGGDREI